MVSIQDVARHAHVGAATVSRVMSGNGYVSEETREKVQRAIEELDYTPNELARNLLHKKTNIVAVIVPDISNPFYATMINQLETVLRHYGYKTMLCNTVGEETNEQAYLDMLQRNMVDGVITYAHSLDTEKYSRVKRPMVALDRFLADDIPVVTVDHKKGGRLAAQAMIDAGCKHVVQFEGANRDEFYFLERHEEFRKQMAEAGIKQDSYITEWDCFDTTYFKKAVKECYEQYPDCDGVFATDLLAMCYMQYALKCGKRVPEDLKIVAYDGTYVIDAASTSVTAIIQPFEKLARTAVDILMKQIQGETIDLKYITLDVGIQYGKTTGQYKEENK